jgi:predicted nucleic acid-binding protein
MRVLPDTPIWSEALRRTAGPVSANRLEMEKLVANGMVEIIGPIRQELLSGIREVERFESLRDRLRVFSDLEIARSDYEAAAGYYNRCRLKGIQGSSTDFLICAVAIRSRLVIFTEDRDFWRYQKVLPIQLYPTPKPCPP